MSTRFLYVFLAFLLATGGTSSFAQDQEPLMRHPALSPDGQTVAFSYQGDVWTVPSDGGRATRLTVHDGYDGHPHWNADGSHIGFVSDRFGNDDVFVMNADGGTPTQLTHHSTDDVLGGWTQDGRLLFTTERTFQQVEWMSEIYHVSAEGGTPDRLLSAFGDAPEMSPDGRFIAFERGANRTEKKGYDGPSNRNVWVYDTENDAYTQVTTFPVNDFAPTWGGPRTLFFISEESGTHNVYRQALTDAGQPDGQPQQVTSFDGDGARTLSVSADGSAFVFERQTDVYVVRDGGTPQRLDVTVPSDYRYAPVERMTMNNRLRQFAVSPNGERVALALRGEIFVMENDPEESRTVRLTDSAYRDRDPMWLTDSTLVFASDRDGGQYDLYRLESADPEHTGDLYDALQHRVVRLTETPEDERVLGVAPDGETLALRRGSISGYGAGQLLTAIVGDDGSLSEETVLADGWNAPDEVAFSPDGQWLAYSMSDLDFNAEVYVHAADGSADPVNVTQHPRSDGSPVWSPDGSKLGFTSARSSGDTDVWFVWLKESDWEKTQRDWEELKDDDEAPTPDDEDGEEETPEVDIDFENIHERLQRVTAMPGNEADPVIASDGDTFYFVAGRSGRTGQFDVDVDLYSIQWDGSERTRVTDGGIDPSNVRLGPGGSHLFLTHAMGQLARVDTKKDALEPMSFAAKMTVDFATEREQIFAEVWRQLDAGFYDPQFHGDDWTALRDKYRPWAMKASTRRDFQAIVNLMLGELNASHMGYYAQPRGDNEQRAETGLLGIEGTPVEDGFQVDRVVPRSPAHRSQSRLREGDVITAVDGTPVGSDVNVYSLLEGTAKEKVLLSVRSGDDTRAVRIRPTDDLGDALYQEWVDERARLTEEYSNGRLGYIHIEGMNWQSFERFERELYASGNGKEGLLIDVRYNGGGWTTDYLMTVLNVRRHAYTVPRGATDDLDANHEQFRAHYPFGERLPYAAWTKPVAALCNQNSYSNAEIFSHAFKNLDHGTLVGQPTFGAVISTGGARMIDGSFVRMPFRAWYVYQTDENMEHGPAVPDVLIEQPADVRGRGDDPQLQRAVEVLLEQIDGQTAQSPDASDGDGSSSSEGR